MDSGFWCIAVLVHLWILAAVVALVVIARRQREHMNELERRLGSSRSVRAYRQNHE